MNNIMILFAGKKSSGKDSLCDFLIRNTKELNNCGSEYCYHKIGFGDGVKNLIHDLFGIPYDILYGNDSIKTNYITNIKKDCFSPINKNNKIENKEMQQISEFLTVRELMQQIGKLFRKMDVNVWVNRLLNEVKTIEFKRPNVSNIVFINDCRFPNEIKLCQKFCNKKGYKFLTVRLTRKIKNDDDESETALDDKTDLFDIIITNQNQSLAQTQLELMSKLNDYNLFS